MRRSNAAMAAMALIAAGALATCGQPSDQTAGEDTPEIAGVGWQEYEFEDLAL